MCRMFSGKPATLYDSAHPDWAPSVRLSAASNVQPDGKKLSRYQRTKGRAEAKGRHVAAEALLDLSISDVAQDDVVAQPPEPVEVGGDLPGQNATTATSVSTSDTPSLLESTASECQRLLTENSLLRQQLRDREISLDSLRDDVRKVRLYTGLPSFATLMTLFLFLEPYIPESTRISLPKGSKLLLVLMKLRRNFPIQDLAYRFGISKATASRTFLAVLHVMFVRLQRYIYWPERDELRRTMPMEFRKHFGRKVCVIIDCFEVFIETPSNAVARNRSFSSYKHHHTVKFLIGITPQGSVSFLSRAYCGRVSDKHITEHSGFLDKILPGDIVLADRGFDIQESVGLKGAEVKIPSFTKRRAQMNAFEIESTRNIAHVRIHVERVIGLVRNKYTILSGILPLDYMQSSGSEIPTVDKIATVCCCLTNLCESVVPFN